MSIINDKNLVKPQAEHKPEKDYEFEAMQLRISMMTMDELWGEDKPMDNTELILKMFPGSKVVSETPAPKIADLSSLLDKPDPEPRNEEKTAFRQEINDKKTLLESALRYIKQGKSIIPVGKDKRPLIKWEEFQRRIASETEVISWFQNWPKAQIGMVTGAISNLAVVDVEKEYGDYKNLNLPDTSVSKTGSGGFHLFYRYTDGIRNRAKVGGQDVDIRGEGGYVILPPSSNNAGKYEWIILKEQLPTFPVSIFGEETKKVEKFDKTKVEEHEFVDMDYQGVGEGQRNDEMTRYIGALLTQVHPKSWETVAWPIVQLANQKNDPPLDDGELERTYESVCKIEMESDQKRFYETQEEQKKTQKALELRKQLERGDDKIVHISTAADASRERSYDVFSSGFVNFDQVMKGGFKNGDLTIITGISGEGKTSVAQTFTYNLSEIGQKCVWFSWEVTHDVLDEKFRQMGINNFYNVYVPMRNTSGNIDWLSAKIQEAIDNFGARCVFIDMIEYVVPNDVRRSDNEQIILKNASRQLKDLARENGVMIFAMAHVRKLQRGQKEPELQDISSSGGIYHFADYVFAVARRKEKTDGRFKTVQNDNRSKLYMLKNRTLGVLREEDCEYINERFITHTPAVKPLNNFTYE